MDNPTVMPTAIKAEAKIAPETSLLDIGKYLLSKTGKGKSGLKTWRAVVAAALAYMANEKWGEVQKGTTTTEISKKQQRLIEWHNDVSNRLQRLEAYAVAPPNSPFKLRASQFPAIPGVTNPPGAIYP